MSKEQEKRKDLLSITVTARIFHFDDSTTRQKQLSFRVSEEEYQQLQEKISESGKNQQEYILSCVLEKQIFV